MYPNLIFEKEIVLDIETYDPDLKKLGPGPRRDGYILGVAIGTRDRQWYFKNSDDLYKWLYDLQDKTFIGHNITYDLDFLQYKNFKPQKLIDTMFAEALINENQFHYSLDFCAMKYLNERKIEIDYKKIHELDFEKVSQYAKRDIELTYEIWKKQKPILKDEDLISVFDLECSLIPLMLQMRKVGIRIDEENLEKIEIKYSNKIKKLKHNVDQIANCNLNVRSNKQMREVYDKLGYSYKLGQPTPKTKKINAKFDKAHRSIYGDPLSIAINELKQYEEIYLKFIKPLPKFIIDERVHCLFHQCKTDGNGTVTGRFSSSLPNLQQIPKNNEEAMKDLRGIFLPDKNKKLCRIDYGQIELRMLAHYAVGNGSNQIRKVYNQNPNIDYHQMCADMAGVPRKICKHINFGIVYGMGATKLCQKLKLSEQKGKILLYKYHNKFPFLKQTSKHAMQVAETRGHVKTILGRRRRFPEKKGTYRALNAVLQGSAADVMKKAMLDAWKAGLFEKIIPHLTVHDELVCSFDDIKDVRELQNIMENTIKFKVPLIAGPEIGNNWANTKKLEKC